MRCRTEADAVEMGQLYCDMIRSLPIEDDKRNALIDDVKLNWLCDEWLMSWIDAGRLPYPTDRMHTTIMNTNNLTERINRSLEGNRRGIPSYDTFIENLYGVALARENVNPQESGQLVWKAGLITTWIQKHTERAEAGHHKLTAETRRRLNQGRLLVLRGCVQRHRANDENEGGDCQQGIAHLAAQRKRIPPFASKLYIS
jgi:hypothetical protein